MQNTMPVSMLNVSSVILKCYPEASPWNLDLPVFGVSAPDLEIYRTMSEAFRSAARAQAERTGWNPLHFICWSNPFVLDNVTLAQAALPFNPPPADTVASLPLYKDQHTISFVEAIHVGDACIVCRVLVGVPPRRRLAVLKLFVGSHAESNSEAESAAYARFLHSKIPVDMAVVPRCHGQVEVSRQFLHTIPLIREGALDISGGTMVKGLLLEDLAGAETLTIHNITPAIAEKALRSLYTIHTAHVLHGAPLDRQNVLLLPAEQRVVWVGFSHSTCYGRPANAGASVSRQSLLAEMAQGWNLLYQRLLPDSLIGFEAAPEKSLANPYDSDLPTRSSTRPPHWAVRPRPYSSTVRDEIVNIVFSYPEVNLFDWSPPVFNLIPAPRNDHHYDTREFLQALRDIPGAFAMLFKWYGSCPLAIFDQEFHIRESIPGFPDFVAPSPLPQLPSETTITFLEHIHPSGHHAIMRVQLGSEERLLKIFSKDRLPSAEDDDTTSKERFETERDAYAHLLHYGACASGAVPKCYGWLELSSKHVRDANAMIQQTRQRGEEPGGEPVSVSPVFEDDSCAAALVLEYLFDAEPLSISTVTHSRAELALRALSCVHGAYVRHCDLRNPANLLVMRGADGADRVVVIDFDCAQTPQIEVYLRRLELLEELYHLWLDLFQCMLPLRRIRCQSSCHPYCELDVF